MRPYRDQFVLVRSFIIQPPLIGHYTFGWAFGLCEQLASHAGPTVGGLLNATFGNATETIISIHASNSRMIRVVQQSLLGSIFSNLLLVLGCFFMEGIIHHKKVQDFNKAYTVVNSGYNDCNGNNDSSCVSFHTF